MLRANKAQLSAHHEHHAIITLPCAACSGGSGMLAKAELLPRSACKARADAHIGSAVSQLEGTVHHDGALSVRVWAHMGAEEGVTLAPGAMETLSKVSGGDLRRAITTLQSAVRLQVRAAICAGRGMLLLTCTDGLSDVNQAAASASCPTRGTWHPSCHCDAPLKSHQ